MSTRERRIGHYAQAAAGPIFVMSRTEKTGLIVGDPEVSSRFLVDTEDRH